MNRFADHLAAAGMSEREAAAKQRLFARALKALSPIQTDAPLRAFYVPGRVEVLGKHTDYAGGRSLLGNVERGFCVIARERPDHEVHVINARSNLNCRLSLDAVFRPPERHWGTYPSAVVRRLARNFPHARRGADISFISDLPAASGMSSSSAFMVAIFLALAEINGLAGCDEYRREIRNKEDLAGYLGTVENGQSFGALTGDQGVGTFGGSEDHTAILCCEAGEMRQYSFCPIRHEHTTRLPQSLTLAIAVSGVTAIKTGAAKTEYNRASLAARTILGLWHKATGRTDPTLAAALFQAPDAAAQLRAILRRSHDENFPPEALGDRFEHFFEESTVIIPAAVLALHSGDLAGFGLWVDRSQRGAEKLLKNQVPETVALARSARALGAIASSAFGAGFGGSVWALVRAECAPEFLHQWEACYRDDFPGMRNSRFFCTRPGPPALSIHSQI